MLDNDGNPYADVSNYATPPMTATYYFTARDAFHTAATYRTDMSFNYARKLGMPRRLEVFVNAQVLNVFNQAELSNRSNGQINSRVLTSVDSAKLKPFDPFTTAPVQGVNWNYGSKFGKATSASAYTQPRTFRFSVGMKF